MGLWIPGVSRKVIWPSGLVTMPRTTCRVVCGLSVTMDTFSPTTRFSSVDFPEFGRPMMETNPDLLMRFASQRFDSKTFDAAPVRIEDFNLDSPVLDLLSSGRQPAKQLDNGAGDGRAIGVRNQRESEFFFEHFEL